MKNCPPQLTICLTVAILLRRTLYLFIIRLHKGGTVNQSQTRLHAYTEPIDTSEPGILLNPVISRKFFPAEHTSERPHCIEKISTSPGGFGSYVGTEKRQCRSHRSAVLSKIPLFCHLFFSALLFTKKRTPHRMPQVFPPLYTTRHGQRPPQKKNHSHTSRFPQ